MEPAKSMKPFDDVCADAQPPLDSSIQRVPLMLRRIEGFNLRFEGSGVEVLSSQPVSFEEKTKEPRYMQNFFCIMIPAWGSEGWKLFRKDGKFSIKPENVDYFSIFGKFYIEK